MKARDKARAKERDKARAKERVLGCIEASNMWWMQAVH